MATAALLVCPTTGSRAIVELPQVVLHNHHPAILRILQQLHLNLSLGANADPVGNVNQQFNEIVCDFLFPLPAQRGEQRMPYIRRVAAQFARRLACGALPVMSDEPRGRVAKQLLRQPMVSVRSLRSKGQG